MAETSTIKIQKIKVAGLPIYPATILDAVKDAKPKVIIDGAETTNPNYGKTLREILTGLTPAGVSELQADVEKLLGADTVEGSVAKQIKDAISALVNGADVDFDTLKEIADWIKGDGADATALIATVGHAATESEVATGLFKVIEDAVKTVSLSDAVGMVYDEDSKTWSAGTATAQLNGLATAADVAAEIVADEQVIATALNDHETRINSLENTETVSVEDCSDTTEYTDVF